MFARRRLNYVVDVEKRSRTELAVPFNCLFMRCAGCIHSGKLHPNVLCLAS